jgi:hypothetical protein
MRRQPAYLVPRHGALSPLGLATIVAALHLAALAGRVSARHPHGRHVAMLIWRPPKTQPAATARVESDRVPSNPTHSYSAGRLALAAGMAIVALTFQLQLMRLGAALSR